MTLTKSVTLAKGEESINIPKVASYCGEGYSHFDYRVDFIRIGFILDSVFMARQVSCSDKPF